MLNGEGTDDKDINMQRNNLHLNCLQYIPLPFQDTKDYPPYSDSCSNCSHNQNLLKNKLKSPQALS